MHDGFERRGVLALLAGAAAAPAAATMLPDAIRPDAIRTVASGLAFPEGVVTTRDGGLLFVEIAAGRLSRMAPDGRVSVAARLGGGPNGTTIGADGAIYVANNGGLRFDHVGERWGVAGVPDDYAGGSIQRVDPKTGAATTLYREVGGHRLCGPNDILCDAWGGLWFSDTGKIFHARAIRAGSTGRSRTAARYARSPIRCSPPTAWRCRPIVARSTSRCPTSGRSSPMR